MNTWFTDRRAFESLFNALPNGMLAVDAQGILLASNAACAVLGAFARTDVAGRDVRDVLGLAASAFITEALASAHDGRVRSREVEERRIDGTIVPVRITAVPLARDDSPARLVLVIEDVTPRREAEQRFRSLFEQNPNAVVALTTAGDIEDVNEAYLRLTGRSRDDVIGTNFRLRLRDDEETRTVALFSRAVDGEPVSFDVRAPRIDGSFVELDATLIPKYARSKVVGVYAILQDMTESRAAQRMLEMQAERLRDLYVLATTAEYTDTQVMATLQMGCRMLGVEGGAILETGERVAVDMRYDAVDDYLLDDRKLQEIAETIVESNESVPSDVTGLWIGTRLIVDGALHGVLLFFSQHPRDETFDSIDRETLALMAALVGTALERRRTRTHLRALAYYDSLTGLPNRLFFQERLRDALLDVRGRTCPVAVLFFDLDRFKDLNDTLGHAQGDRFLQLVANRLVLNLGGNGTVARMGGDEFTVLLTNCTTLEEVGAVAEALLRAVDEPYRIDGYEQYLTASIGVAVYPRDGRDDQTLIKNADIAMYRAKSRGGNSFVFYDATLSRPIRSRIAAEKHLRRALQQEQFVLHFQPIFEMEKETVVSVEALVRWNHPQRGLILPDEFVPVAEGSGLIVRLGEWVFANAAKQVRDWHERIGKMSLAVNISARQFHQPGLSERLGELIAAVGIDPRFVELEITETMTLTDAAYAIDTIRALKSMGVRIAVDDFGTGHSSLMYLRRFDVDYIKIDRSFVAGIGTQPDDETIVKAIIAMGHSLGLEVIAEGVETTEQYEFLRSHRCDRVQGFLFSRPLDAQALEKLLTQSRGSLSRPG